MLVGINNNCFHSDGFSHKCSYNGYGIVHFVLSGVKGRSF